MRKIVIGVLALLLVLSIGGMALAEDHDNDEIPPHAHMLVQRPVLGIVTDSDANTGFGVESVRKCVDLAANRPVPLNAHHAHIHTGKAGEQLFEQAGHAVVPTAPLTPWANCAEFEDSLPFVFPAPE